MNNIKNIELETNLNIRDLGNIKVKEGFIKPKMLLRSSLLDSLSDNDIEILKREYNLSTIIDLRIESEIREKPNKKINGVNYIKMPIFETTTLGVTHEGNSGVLGQYINMKELYKKMLHGECLNNISKIINYIIDLDDTNYSVLFHCTEGKDRTGIISAILLMILGVDRKIILEDYLFTNVINEEKVKMYYDKALSMGLNQDILDNIKSIFLAKSEYINVLFDVVDNEWNTTENFIQTGLKIPINKIQTFKRKMISSHF